MSFFSRIKTKPARGLVLLAFCGFLIVAHPRKAAALAAEVDWATGDAFTITSIADDATQIADWVTEFADWLDTEADWLDRKLDYLKDYLRKRIEHETQKALSLGPANAQIDNVRATSEAAHSAQRLADSIRADTTTLCATVALRQLNNMLRSNTKGLAQYMHTRYTAQGNVVNTAAYKNVISLLPVYNYCKLVGSNFSLTDLPYALSQKYNATLCANIFSNASQ